MGMSQRDAYRVMFQEYPDVVNIHQFCEMLGGISTKTGYRILKSGQVEYLKVGREYRIPKINVLVYLNIIEAGTKSTEKNGNLSH